MHHHVVPNGECSLIFCSRQIAADGVRVTTVAAPSLHSTTIDEYFSTLGILSTSDSASHISAVGKDVAAIDG